MKPYSAIDVCLWWPCERTHTFERSHRRTCRHQEYKRIVIIKFLCFLGCLHFLYYTRSIDYGWDKRNRRTLSSREPPTYSTIPHVSSCNVVLLHQTNAYSSGPRSVGGDEIKNPLSALRMTFRTGGLQYTGADTFPTCVPLSNRFSSTSQHRILIDQLLSVVHQEKLTRCANNFTNSSAKRLPPHQITPPYPVPTFTSPLHHFLATPRY